MRWTRARVASSAAMSQATAAGVTIATRAESASDVAGHRRAVDARRLAVEERTQSAKAARGARVRARLGQRLDRFNRRVAGVVSTPAAW
jgi:hypothetical protein